MNTALRRDEAQQVVFMALMLPILLVFVGLVIDVGNLYFHRRTAQNAADAAVMAGSVELAVSRSAAQTAAFAYAAKNGYDNGHGNTVDVTFPGDCVRVQVNEDVRPLLASLVWSGTFDVSASAEACMMVVELGSSVIVLEPRHSEALSVTGNGRLEVTRGNIQVNSSSDEAVTLDGNAQIVTYTPVTIVGDYDKNRRSRFSPTPITGAPVIPDPLAGLPVPTKPKKCTTKEINDSGTLDPGCYSGGIKLSSKERLTLRPGVYWIEEGIKLSAQAELIGSNVMLYIADGDVDLSGGSRCELSPPDSGVYDGITFFGNRSEHVDFDLTGGSSLSGLSGTIYSANGTLDLAGGARMRTNFAVREVEMSGNASLTVEGFTTTNWGSTEFRLTE